MCAILQTQKKVPEPLYKIPGTFQIPDVGKISGRSIR